MNYPKVSIIILNWNGLENTFECLDSLKKIAYHNYEVIVVDNASINDEAVLLEDKYGNYISVIRNKKNFGFCGGNNIGIKKAIENKADYVLLLNNDTTVEPDFLDELVKVAQQDKKIGIIGAEIFDYFTKKPVFTNAKLDAKLKLERRLDYLNSSKSWWETEVISGACEMIRADCVTKYNLLLDENIFLYCDEIDICLRAKHAGYKIAVAGKSKIYHKEGMSYGGGIKPIPVYYSIRNRIYLARKMLGLKESIVFYSLFFPARFARILQWIILRRFDLIDANFCAFNDGIKGQGGKWIKKSGKIGNR